MDAYIRLPFDDLIRQRRPLFDDLKPAQNLHCLASLRANCLPTSNFNLEAIGKLLSIAADSRSIFDRILEIPGISNVRGYISRFIQTIYNLHPQLPELLATIPMSVFVAAQAIQFLPPRIRPCEFLHAPRCPHCLGIVGVQSSRPLVPFSGQDFQEDSQNGCFLILRAVD
jgi:hypothetical protein